MIYEHIAPAAHIKRYIKSYWIVDSEGDATPQVQKIIPDGYPEMIFHYGDPYRININGEWQVQSKQLIAGQIKKHFFLENTGKSGMIGIKFKPAALTQLFGVDMSPLKDNVSPLSILDSKFEGRFAFPDVSLAGKNTFVNSFEDVITEHMAKIPEAKSLVEIALSQILNAQGVSSISALCQQIGLSERQLERQFSKHVGISPKFYARIIRFSHIFELMQNQDNTWSDLVYASGFYDQSHFIKNFKEFTGEDPSAYGFDQRNMANFHLKQ